MWDLRTRKCVAVLSSHVGLPTAATFSMDGATLLTAGRDQLVNVWRWRDFSLTSSIAVLEAIEGLVVVDGGKAEGKASDKSRSKPKVKDQGDMVDANASVAESIRFVTGGEGGLLKTWDASSGRCVQREAAQRASRPGVSRLVTCGDELLAVTADHNLVFHEARSLQARRCVAGNNDEITDIRCLRTSAQEGTDKLPMRLAVATNSEQVKLFNTADMACTLLYGHSDVVLSLDVSQDGRMLASACKDCTARVWRTQDAACLAVCDGHVEAVGAVAFSKRGAALLTASKDKTAKLWDLSALTANAAHASEAPVQRPRAMSTVLAHAKEVNAVAIAPNDRLAVTASQDRSLKVWSVRDGSLAEQATLKL